MARNLARLPGLPRCSCGCAGRRAIRLLLVLAALADVAAPAAAQTWYESYHQAEQALAQQRWSEAVRHLNAALQENPSSSAQARTYGMRFIRYFPYLKLGQAYLELGQLEAARQAFETEQRQKEIEASRPDLSQFEVLLDRLERLRTTAAAAEEDKVVDIVATHLGRARLLEQEGSLEAALSAVSRVLAVDGEQAEALELRRRLLAALAEQQRRRDETVRLARLTRRAEGELAAGRARQAAATLAEVLEVQELPQARALLIEAQAQLRGELEAQQSAQQRTQALERSLQQAQDLERRGRREAALQELQTALALDPTNEEALELQGRWAQAQTEEAAAQQEGEAVRALLTQAEAFLQRGDFDQALRTAHRVLALEPSNQEALRGISRAYRRLGESLLDPDETPPAIVLDQDLVAPAEEGAVSEVRAAVREAEWIVSGTAYDGAPVAVTLVAGEGTAAGDTSLGEMTVESRELQGIWITSFEWRHRLPAGESSFEVVAVDQAGNESRLPVAVVYRPLFTRSWKLPALVALGLGLLVSAVFIARARRRKKLLGRRFNPYIAGAPILEQARFFGRQQLLDYVLRRITNNSLLLYGERRIGKTSFQHRLKRCLSELEDPTHDFYPVYVDLQGTPQEKLFATIAAEVFHELTPKLDGLPPSAPPGGGAYEYRDLVKDLHQVLKVLRNRGTKKVKLVLLIDEVDELNDYDPRVNQRLRSLFMRAFADNLVSVVSGVAIKKQWEREGSPWYNFFQEVEVQPLDPEEARSLIEAPVKGVFSFETGAAEAIVQRTGAKPYLIQRLCSGLVDLMHEGRRQRITLADVESACRLEGL